MSTMELGDRLVHVRSTVKHEKPEKELFTQDDIVFIFSDIVRPVGLILNNNDPLECFVLFPPATPMQDIIDLSENPTRKRDAPSITKLPSPEPGDGNSSKDEEYATLSTPVDTPASTQEEVVQSTTDEPVADPSDLSSDVQTLPDHAPSEH